MNYYLETVMDFIEKSNNEDWLVTDGCPAVSINIHDKDTLFLCEYISIDDRIFINIEVQGENLMKDKEGIYHYDSKFNRYLFKCDDDTFDHYETLRNKYYEILGKTN